MRTTEEHDPILSKQQKDYGTPVLQNAYFFKGWFKDETDIFASCACFIMIFLMVGPGFFMAFKQAIYAVESIFLCIGSPSCPLRSKIKFHAITAVTILLGEKIVTSHVTGCRQGRAAAWSTRTRSLESINSMVTFRLHPDCIL